MMVGQITHNSRNRLDEWAGTNISATQCVLWSGSLLKPCLGFASKPQTEMITVKPSGQQTGPLYQVILLLTGSQDHSGMGWDKWKVRQLFPPLGALLWLQRGENSKASKMISAAYWGCAVLTTYLPLASMMWWHHGIYLQSVIPIV